MFDLTAPLQGPLFTFYPPKGTPQGLVSIPHSGEEVPPEFDNFLTTERSALKEDVDFKVNELVDIAKLQTYGVGVLVAHIHRVCVDLNRSPEQAVLFWKNNTKGVQLVLRSPDPQQESDFIDRYHRPFFEIYSTLLKELERELPGQVPVVDLHSMPSAPTAYHLKQNPHQSGHRPDFCVSDQRGKTCSPAFIGYFAQNLREHQYEVFVNDPYIGGYVTTFVDRFKTNNIQIEINRRLYMDEVRKELKSAEVLSLRSVLTTVLIDGLKAFAR